MFQDQPGIYKVNTDPLEPAAMFPYLGRTIAYKSRWGPDQDIPFSTRDLIWLNYQVVSQLSQHIFFSFSYLNIARHDWVIESCREQNKWFYRKLTYSFVAIDFLAFFQ